jgi:hypothetical protein
MAEKARDTFQIPEWRVEAFLERLAKINRRAAKLDCPEIEVEVGEPYDFKYKEGETERTIRKCEVKVLGEAPHVAGWELKAKLQRIDGILLVAAVPGVSIPEEFREVGPERCDHCHTKRFRVDTFVVHNEAEDLWKVVGRNCLADFLGGHDPKRAALRFEWLIEVASCAEDQEGGGYGGSGYWRFDPIDVLARTAVAVRKDGWLSRGKARESFHPVMATADIVTTDFCAKAPYRNQLKAEVTEADAKEAVAAWEWAATAGEGTDSDYLYNVRQVAKLTSVDARLFGITCSVLVAYRRALEKEIEYRKAKAKSQHFGVVGKREVFELMLKGWSTFEGHYGTTYVYKFLEGDGNQATWFASRDQELEIGKTYTMKCTVKKHEEYKGIPQTMLTRCAKFTPKPKKARKKKEKVA